MDTALTIVKLAGLVLAGAFGALGLLKDFRDDKTKILTKWGKIALYGILISTALAFVAQVLDSAKSAHEAKESEKRAQDQITRSNDILTDLDRSLNPLLRSQMQLSTLILKINTRELWIKGRDRDMKRLENSGPRPFVAYVTVFPTAVDDLQLSQHR